MLALADQIPIWWVDKGRQHAEHQEWADAAQCYARAFALQETFLSDTWFEYAAVELLAGDVKAYEDVCDRFSKLARSTRLRSYHVARAITLWPDHRGGFAETVKFAEPELLRFNSDFWSLTEQGALAFRQGDAARARALCERSSIADPRPGRAVLNWLWLALAEQDAGNIEQARAWLLKSRKWLNAWNQGLPTQYDGANGAHYHNYLEAQILLREVTQQIESKVANP
jgi:hypothetical protein